MKVLYDHVEQATYVGRPNRFVVELDCKDQRILAHLPNPGRMWELLFVGVTVYIVPHQGTKTTHRVIGIDRDGVPIMLDTNYSNDVAQYAIDHKLIPGWESYHVERREYRIGRSRFDLLLADDKGTQFLVEVKSCTLFSKRGAMFPDAITERGRKHLLHLQELQKEGYKSGVLLLVQWEYAHWFLPDYHTDLAFAKTFYEVADHLDWKAIAFKWNPSFTMPEVVRELTYPKDVVAREAHDAGDYMIILHLDTPTSLEIGSKGIKDFPAGYYIYVGSAKANLTKRIERHVRKRKKKHWHLDYFRNVCTVIATVPIRTQDDLECNIAKAVETVADWHIEGFGCSDCACPSHLFALRENPIHYKPFMDLVEDFRMNRLDGLIDRIHK